MNAILTLLLIGTSQGSTDVRRDVYPTPPVESRHALRLPLPDGASVELVAGGKVEAGGKVVCWDAKGRIDSALSDRVGASYRADKSIDRRMPKGSGHRFLVYRYRDIPAPGTRGRQWGIHQSAGFVNLGEDLSTRLLPFASRAKALSLLVDVIWHVPNLNVRPMAGEVVSVGRGTVRIEEIRERENGITEIRASTQCEVYKSLMFLALDSKGKQIGSTDLEGNPLPPGAKPLRAALARGINTLGMRPGYVAVALRNIDRLAVSAPYVRRYELYGIPANPVQD
ncbi:MAG: hypothetical protein KIS66_13295 [Fimbriimonadaceae bacterium]|nr:hypothetical protein [Fimbriimonadaceae bacterium]